MKKKNSKKATRAASLNMAVHCWGWGWGGEETSQVIRVAVIGPNARAKAN